MLDTINLNYHSVFPTNYKHKIHSLMFKYRFA